MIDNAFDLSILDSGMPDHAVALARAGPDLALAKIPFGTKLRDLLEFRDRIDALVRGGGGTRPSRAELADYGHELFEFAIRDDILRLYNRLPSSHIRVHILSDHSDLQRLPLEYLQEPNGAPGPSRTRTVIRIVPTVGLTPLQPSPKGQLRVLFVSSDPSDLDPVSWPAVKERIERTFRFAISREAQKKVVLEAVEGPDSQRLRQVVGQRRFDVFHFSGHGDVQNGVGGILLKDAGGKSDRVDAIQLAQMISGCGLKLVILSACDTATGDFKDDFSVMAQALIRSGIPAVIANQLPIPDASVATFVGAFYESLLDKGDIDVAINEGRIALDLALGSSTQAAVEWGIPTLYRHVEMPMIYRP